MKFRWRQAAIVAGLIVLFVSLPAARADDEPKPDQLKKMYDDALGQLRAAQDRKNELATENDKLRGKIAEQEKALSDAHRQLAETDSKTYFLRSYFATWQIFLQRYPRLKAQWDVFLEQEPLRSPNPMPVFKGSAE